MRWLSCTGRARSPRSTRRPSASRTFCTRSTPACPGGLKQAWPEFAKAAWNEDPVEPNFTQWDNFTQHPEQDGHEIATEQVNAAPSGQTEVDVPVGLDPLDSHIAD